MINKIRQQWPEYEDMGDDDLMTSIHQAHYADMPRAQFDQACCADKPDHDDLSAAAVTGEDSLYLQSIDPSVKPAVKMTAKELAKHMDKVAGKMVVMWNDVAYVIDPAAVDPSAIIEAVLTGNDSEILGYPQRGPMSAAVTKQGDVVTDLPAMKTHAATKNVQWAATGEYAPLMAKATAVSDSIKRHFQGATQ